MANNSYFYGLGRRKAATATARLTKGKGKITINSKPANEFLSDNKNLLGKLTTPAAIVDKQNDFDISLLIKGGGVNGQVEAAILAIAKALASIDDATHAKLSKAGLLRRDSREVERKKYGLKGARRKEQFSKR